MLLTAIIFLLILSVLVLIHEAGHFFVAKKFGIKVEEFGFGLPPRAIGKKIGETIYSLNWLPIGGFVKLYGEDEAGAGRPQLKVKSEKLKVADEKRAFYARPVWQRALVVVAGVLMNALLAVVIYYSYLFISGFKAELPLIGDHKFFLVNQTVKSDLIIGSVSKNSPAEKAGMKPFIKIESVNGKQIKDTQTFVSVINSNKGKQVNIVWRDVKTNQQFKANIVPRVSTPKNEGALGVAFFSVNTAVVSYDTPLQKVFSGFIHPANLLVYNFDVLGKLVAVSIKEKTAAPLSGNVAGPIGIYSLVGSIVKITDIKEKILQTLNLAGILSISLAFFNVLPIPALDGGRLFFILVEGAIGKKINPRFESFVHAIGMAILLGLIALITFQDLVRIFSGKNPLVP
ncbi:MAG: site-2 protease family protein [Candidatus Levybacteria bacterium]|nr:site-2 protease family protein [Candidatus Levybacteria bacterium]